MQNKIVEVETIKIPIQPSPGFAKKDLSTYKLDILALCGYGCRYCSSNNGMYLRRKRAEFRKLTGQQTGKQVLPSEDPSLMFVYPKILENLREQISKKTADWGAGETLVFSMLTDGFSPLMVDQGVTEAALQMVLDRTSFRIRVLTKNSIVGEDKWIKFFRRHPDRFVVGLSTGNLDDNWARTIEIGVPVPSERLQALKNLQAAGVPTFGMLCPVFTHLLDDDSLEKLVDQTNPQAVEQVWVEPFNDRANWKIVRSSYPRTSRSFQWITDVYESGHKELWSQYATDLYLRIYRKAVNEGWSDKLRYLLYENLITEDDATRLGGLDGILLQSKPDENGLSKNEFIAQYQNASKLI